MFGIRRGGIAVPVVSGMKQQRGAAADADIADRQEQRAGGLAVTVDPEQLAGLIVLADHWIEAPGVSAHLEAADIAGLRRARRQDKGQPNRCSRADHSSGSVVKSSG